MRASVVYIDGRCLLILSVGFTVAITAATGPRGFATTVSITIALGLDLARFDG